MKILVKEYLKAENRNSYYRKHFHFATGASRSDSLQISFDCRLSDLLASSGWLWLKRWSHRRRGEGRCRAQLCTCCGSRCQWEPVPASARSPVTTRVPLPPRSNRWEAPTCMPARFSRRAACCHIGQVCPHWQVLYSHTLACTFSAKGFATGTAGRHSGSLQVCGDTR